MSKRSRGVSAEWSTATSSPKRARKRATSCGVSAISGTSTIEPRFGSARRGDGAQVDLGLAAAGDAVERGTSRRCRAPRAPRRSRRPPPAAPSVASGGTSRSSVLGEERIARRLALLDADEPLLDEPLHRPARAAELLLEARERQGAVRANDGEHARGVLLDRRLDDVGGEDPLDLAGGHALRRREERRLLDRARRLAIDRRQREAHDLADGREVVAGEPAEERDEVLRQVDALEHVEERLRLRRRLSATETDDDADDASRANRAEDPPSERDARRELVRDEVRQRPRQRDGHRDVRERHRALTGRCARAGGGRMRVLHGPFNARDRSARQRAHAGEFPSPQLDRAPRGRALHPHPHSLDDPPADGRRKAKRERPIQRSPGLRLRV